MYKKKRSLRSSGSSATAKQGMVGTLSCYSQDCVAIFVRFVLIFVIMFEWIRVCDFGRLCKCVQETCVISKRDKKHFGLSRNAQEHFFVNFCRNLSSLVVYAVSMPNYTAAWFNPATMLKWVVHGALHSLPLSALSYC